MSKWQHFLADQSRRWRSYAVGGVVALSLLMAGTLYGGASTDDDAAARVEALTDEATLAELTERARTVRSLLERTEEYYELEVEPIRRVLLRYRDDPELASGIATALVREANRADLEPRLLLAVLLVENPWLDPEIRSVVGAVGLMQVMPVHRSQWGCGDDLEDVDVNICHGARIFAHYVQRTGGDLERALLRYNGCVRGTNTPNCHQYPSTVLALAERESVLSWLTPGTGTAAASK